MIRSAILLTSLLTSFAVAAESRPISLSRTEPDFQRFIRSLKHATRIKDAAYIYAQLASDYYIARDFGGTFDKSATPAQNFSFTFQFDNTQLMPEYKDHGWREFRTALSGKTLERKKDGQLCMPHGALDAKPFPESQLCFRKIAGKWQIQGQINGGD